MDRVGGPVGCSTAKIGSWKLLGLLEFDPPGLLACNDACNCLRHSKGVGLKLGRVYPTGE
jgi:hypothetical protein